MIICFPPSNLIILVAVLHHNVHQIQKRRIRWLILGICTFGILRCAHQDELILHAFKSITIKHSTFFKHLQECSQTWNENLMVPRNGIISCNTFTQHSFHFFIEVLRNIYIHHDLSNNIFTNVNKYITNKILIIHLHTFVKMHPCRRLKVSNSTTTTFRQT